MEALRSARAQVEDYARGAPNLEILVDDEEFPTEYELRFTQPSLAPGPDPDAEPVPIAEHEVVIVLGASFPQTPPAVFWESPIFHPNIFPNYDSAPSREQPEYRGLVCLGDLLGDFTPELDFGALCQTIVDLAGFRGVGIVDVDDNGEPSANFYDKAAAVWFSRNAGRLADLIGAAAATLPGGPGRLWRGGGSYRNQVEPLGPEEPRVFRTLPSSRGVDFGGR